MESKKNAKKAKQLSDDELIQLAMKKREDKVQKLMEEYKLNKLKDKYKTEQVVDKILDYAVDDKITKTILEKYNKQKGKLKLTDIIDFYSDINNLMIS